MLNFFFRLKGRKGADECIIPLSFSLFGGGRGHPYRMRVVENWIGGRGAERGRKRKD